MDTTLRDGEQTAGISFKPSEKLTLAKILLDELNIDRLEVASALVSEGELDAVKRIANWANEAGHLQRIEVLTFVDKGRSIKWMKMAGVKVQNLLTKGSLNHLEHQLRKIPEEHFSDISEVLQIAVAAGIDTNVYLEDWSNGMKYSPEYTFQYLDFLATQPVKRVLLPDTLGVLTPAETSQFIGQIVKRYPNLHFDFHGHNDYDMSVSNSMEAVKAGCHGLHLTVNGMGERAGNAPLASTIAVINDFLPDVSIRVDETALFKVSKIVSAFSGFIVPVNKPIVGDNVFTQTAGIHADGDSKKNLYFNDLLPERFGRRRRYALGKTSGKANILKNLEQLGLTLKKHEVKRVTERIIELGDRKESVTREDLPYIISDVLHNDISEPNVAIESYILIHGKGQNPSAALKLNIQGTTFEENAEGDGQFDAFMNALEKIYISCGIGLPRLVDYTVRIPPGSHTDALCETKITWTIRSKELMTTGLDPDQTVSAIKATEKMLNLI